MSIATPTTVLVMAAGTGGHVFPALAIARKLLQLGARVEWLGTQHGLENELLADSEFPIHRISVSGLRGAGIKRKLMAPFMLLMALLQSLRVIRSVQPDCVLGMGGFVSGPGGVAARLLGKPLLIHEQNAVAGITNRILARIATRVFEAFPHTFPATIKALPTGNPLRAEIEALHGITRNPDSARSLHLLVLGGSMGAAAINAVIPPMLACWSGSKRPQVLHQTGARSLEAVRASYAQAGVSVDAECRVEAFVTDMAAAYRWADIVVCRSGASTVSELAAVGLPAILVPYPHHSDQQQVHNANWLVTAGAAQLVMQSALTAEHLLAMLQDLDADRSQLQAMSQAASALALGQAGAIIANACQEVAHA